MSDRSDFGGNGWTKYQLLVLDTLEKQNKQLEGLQNQLNAINIALAMLQVKAGVWGLLAGAIPAAIMIFIETVKAR